MFLLAWFLATTAAAAQGSRFLPEAHPESVHVVRRQTEVFFIPRSEEALATHVCRHLSPSDLSVRFRGHKGQVTGVDYLGRPSMLVFASDYSSSVGRMAPYRFLRQMLRLATDPALWKIPITAAPFEFDVALFPCWRKREQELCEDLDARVAALSASAGVGTHGIWESLYVLGRFLKSLPGLKAAFVMTDEEDYGPSYLGEATEILLGVPDVTIFSVTPVKHRRFQTEEPAMQMPLIAERTGGMSFRGVQAFASAMPLIAERLTTHAVITFRAKTDGSPETVGRMSIHTRPDVPCRAVVVPPRPPQDLTAWARRKTSGKPLDAGKALAQRGLIAAPALVRAAGLSIRVKSPLLQADDRWFDAWATAAPRFLVARGPAITSDAGPRTAVAPYWRRGTVGRGSGGGAPRIEERLLAVAVPPVEEVTEHLHDVADAVLWLAGQGISSGREQPGWPFAGSPVVVEGKTALEWQEGLSEALRLSFPDYRAWIAARRKQAIAAEVRRITGGKALDPAARAAIERSVTQRGLERGRWRDWVFAGGVLGDVPLQDLEREIDRRLAQAWLDGDAAGSDRWLARNGEAVWEKLTGWFPTAPGVRTLALLVPVYDEVLDKIGFFRIVLPRGHLEGAIAHGMPVDFAPEAPVGLRSVRAAVEQGILRRPGWEVTDVEYAAQGRHRVEVRVHLRDRPAGGRVIVEGKFSREPNKNMRGFFEYRLLEVAVSPEDASGETIPGH